MGLLTIRNPLNLILLCLCCCGCRAFSGSQRSPSDTRPRHPDRQIGQTLSLWAKPPPTSAFDLDTIEAFEATMDLEQMGDESNEFNNEDIVDDDNDDDYDDLEESSIDDRIRLFTVPQELQGKRLDAVLSELEPTMSRSVWGNLIVEGCVNILSKEGGTYSSSSFTSIVPDRKSYKVEAGSTLRVILPTEQNPSDIVAQNLPLDILFEDEHMIILNKAAGMVVHPAAGNWDGTVVNALAYYLAKESRYGAGDFVDSNGKVRKMEPIGSSTTGTEGVDDHEGMDGGATTFRPGIVHRLDKGTTGILVVAKTSQALSTLSAAFAERKVKKTYLAITGKLC
jgi:23S rRNA pseudouridine1911/1915/1917 synthase